MRSIQVLLRKEDIVAEKMKSGSKTAVVLDILLATSTIIYALKCGAKEVVPVLDFEEAKQVYQQHPPGTAIIAGEYMGKPLENHIYPTPKMLEKTVGGKTLILSTTNGTVALRKASMAKTVYVSSLLNNQATSEAIAQEKSSETIVIICSGNAGQFSLEDFYGAGHLIDSLIQLRSEEFELNDAAIAAYSFYRNHLHKPYDVLVSSQIGKMLHRFGLDEDLTVIGQKNKLKLTAKLENQKITGRDIEILR